MTSVRMSTARPISLKETDFDCREQIGFSAMTRILSTVSAILPAMLITSAVARMQEEEAKTYPSKEALEAKVIEVKGKVEYAAPDADPLDVDAWKPVKEEMMMAEEVQIRTGLRSRCVLMFGEAPDQTVISIRRASLASIREFRRSKDEQRVRIGLGYGIVRGGSSEGTLRSDVVVDSTVATLAKRGTEGFQLEVEPVSGMFKVSLARSGLVEAIERSSGEHKFVRPREYATPRNIALMWVNQDIFDRTVRFFALESLTQADLTYLTANRTGFGLLSPDGHHLAAFAGNHGFVPTGNSCDTGEVLSSEPTVVIEPDPVHRPEGNFGFTATYRLLVPANRAAHLSSRLLDRSRRSAAGTSPIGRAVRSRRQ